ncbi:PorT family protein [Hymenobacter sp. 5516J-16]|uniref:PorT family protein n=1 Tax=Hymenobacter sp. 5516J-16 TaxID=2932253 RepID=UPI001FD5DC47|nr:PorT family protein [Hymenobacter sp. 5516J-16]UOQ75789.1 PorT family protein [Hymenobacter sp. 5516J-16]
MHHASIFKAKLAKTKRLTAAASCFPHCNSAVAMKKALLALLISGATIGAASAQVEIGLKVSPSITHLRANSLENGLQNEKAKLSLGGGLIVDYFFGENYAFSTGLELTGKGALLATSTPSLMRGSSRKSAYSTCRYPLR